MRFCINDVIVFDSNTMELFYKDESGLIPVNNNIEIIDNYSFKNINCQTKSKSPTIIKIALGKKCNYSCAYCMQKTTNESEEVNLQLFKDSIDKNMNIDNNLYRIELWGGEPSLYKKEIVELIEYFREKVSKELKLEIFISTNGTLLEDISFIENLYTYRNLDIGFGISHDGELQLENRGKTIKDIVFENLKKIAIIEESNKNNTKISYSFNLTLTNNNHNIINIFKYFNELFNKYNLKSRAINFQIIKGTDSDSKKYSFDSIDLLNSLGKNLKDFFDSQELIEKMNINSNLTNMDFGYKKIREILFQKRLNYYSKTTCALDAENVITIDLKGNIKDCPHVNYSIGNIENIEQFRVNKYFEEERKLCSDCIVKSICLGVCPIMDKKDIDFNYTCFAEFLFHFSKLEYIFKNILNTDKLIFMKECK